jgi:hypothetical protein
MNDTRRRMAVPLLPGMRVQDPRSFAKPRTQTLAVKNGVHGVYKLVIAHLPSSHPSHGRGDPPHTIDGDGPGRPYSCDPFAIPSDRHA